MNSTSRSRRRFIAVIVLCLTAAAGAFIGIGSIRTATDAQSSVSDIRLSPATIPTTFRVATMNIRGGVGITGREDLQLTAQTLEGFDVIGLNEVYGSFSPPDQLQTLSKLTNLNGKFFPSERRYWHDSFGNGILSRFPINSWSRLPLASLEESSRRNVTIVRLGSRQLTVLITHIARHEDQAQQLAFISKLFIEQPEPAILMGDLNATSEHPIIASLLKNPGVLNPIDTKLPYLTGKHIDWILVRGLEVQNAGLRNLGASDHPLVWAELNANIIFSPNTSEGDKK